MPPIDVPELVRATNGFSAYNPMQRQALSAGLFDKNLVIASPTASGKTIIAELSGLDSILNRKKKAIYLAPLRALASEHYRDFKQKYGASQRIRFGISTGDFDSSSQYLSKYDMIFCTNEKLDSLLRHKAEWLSQVGLLIVDEVHLLGSDRGPVLEMVLTQFRHLNPAVRIVALSATIPNSDAIAQWLSATLVQSDYRPVPLSEGVYFDGEIRFRDRVETLDNTERDAVKALVADTLHKKNKQVLVFANTRPAAQQAAKKLAAVTVRSLSDAQKQRLQKASRAILSALEQPTDQCKLLAGLVAEGAAFHHAGLVEKQRRVVESAFKKNLVKVICATPTLAAGINLPAYRVLISSTYRYGENGSERISVSEYKQMAGRSGRPKYDDRGEAIMLSSSVTETDFLLDHYANGALEDIESRLGVEPVLRTHLLATIANAYVSDLDSLQSFFSKTFYCHQFGSIDSLLATLIDVKDHLQEIGFVHESDKKFVATPLGKRVSELYLDPVSARQILDGLDTKIAFSPLSYLFLFCSTSEMAPSVTVPKKREIDTFDRLQQSQGELTVQIETALYSDPQLVKKFFSAELLEAWISELPDPQMTEQFNVQPGILRQKLLRCDWLAFCAQELSKLTGQTSHTVRLGRLRDRLKYGVREELLVLTQFRGIGRVRARRLWQNNVRSVQHLKDIDMVDLGRLIGDEVAQKIKQQVGPKKE